MDRLGLQDSDFKAVYAGSLVNYEGLDDLILAISILQRNWISARAVIVGMVPSALTWNQSVPSIT